MAPVNVIALLRVTEHFPLMNATHAHEQPYAKKDFVWLQRY